MGAKWFEKERQELISDLVTNIIKQDNEIKILQQREKMLETVIDLHVKGIDAREEDMKRKNETIEALKEIIRDLRNFINKVSKELEG